MSPGWFSFIGDVGGLFVRRLRAGLRPVSDHTLCRLCVCVCARWGAKKGEGGGAFRARKPTATFMTARVASGVSHIKKSKAKKQQRSKLYTVVVTAVWVLRMEKGYER